MYSELRKRGTSAVGALRAARLLIRLRLRRARNQLAAFFRYRMGSPDRKATSRTSPLIWILNVFVAVYMLGIFTTIAWNSLENLQDRLGTVQAESSNAAPVAAGRVGTPTPPRAAATAQRVPPAPGSRLSRAVLQGATFLATLLLVSALVFAIANRDILRPEWDLEWLVTLPVPLDTLLASRLLERVATSAAGFVAFAPFLSALAWTCGHRWSAPLIGIALTVPLLFLLAIVQALVETSLRLSLPPSRLRNLHALMSILAIAPAFLYMSTSMPGGSFVWGWVSAQPGWVTWLPPGLAVRALASANSGVAALYALAMIAEIAAAVAFGFALLRWLMRNGVVAVGVRDAVPRAQPSAPRNASRTSGPALLSTVQRRELRLLARDRNYMVQSLVLPALLVAMQLLLNAGTGALGTILGNTSHLAALAFGVAAYTLVFSTMQTINGEGHALWILYCVPHSLESVLAEKAKLWAAVAALYPVAIFATAAATTQDISREFVAVAVVVLTGVPILTVIGTAIGVFACDPLEQDIQRRVRITYLYLYMLLASLYAFAIYAPTTWQRVAMIVLTALVAVALWQKARDHFDYLLDPAASPPSRVSVSDGLIAALIFFVIQGVVLLIWFRRSQTPSVNGVWIAFCVAGAVTYGSMRLVYWRARTQGVPRLLGEGVPGALLWGLAGGLAAALVAIAYLKVVLPLDLFSIAQQAVRPADPWLAVALAAVAIVAAPFFEEFIFRGLVFGGLRRSLGPAVSALASAAIFALVHPAISVAPVFVMGFCAALVYERTRMLAAPIVLHAVYNAAVIAFQWSGAQ
jgi:membrane protease YdiL (CAAX protease family)